MDALKKIAVALLALVVGFNCYAAKPSEEDVENYKASVMSYLRTEGYMPQLDSDGDIAFKHDGDKYWVETEAYGGGYYVTLMTLTPVTDISISTVRKAMDETVRGLKFVRMYSISDGSVVSVSYNWYCFSISDFKRMFSDALRVVSTADSRFIKAVYSK